jgi:DNA-binding transcriptional regulator GbsR (MarR family)
MKQFIEDMGILYEEMGLPRMAGRIIGWLLMCEPPHQSAEELARIVEASKGSISSMTRLLIQMGIVERIGLPGKRDTYYRIKPGFWSELMKTHLDRLTALRKLVERGLDFIAGKDLKIPHRLQEMRDFCVFWEQEIPAMMERYDQEHKQATQMFSE